MKLTPEQMLEMTKDYIDSCNQFAQHLSLIGMTLEITRDLVVDNDPDGVQGLELIIKDLSNMLGAFGTMTGIMRTIYNVDATNILTEMLEDNETPESIKRGIAEVIIPAILGGINDFAHENNLSSEEISKLRRDMEKAIENFNGDKEELHELLRSLENGDTSKLDEVLNKILQGEDNE